MARESPNQTIIFVSVRTIDYTEKGLSFNGAVPSPALRLWSRGYEFCRACLSRSSGDYPDCLKSLTAFFAQKAQFRKAYAAAMLKLVNTTQ